MLTSGLELACQDRLGGNMLPMHRMWFTQIAFTINIILLYYFWLNNPAVQELSFLWVNDSQTSRLEQKEVTTVTL